MMKKPEKIGCVGHGWNYSLTCGDCHKSKARNQTIDEYEAWLKDGLMEEISKEILSMKKVSGLHKQASVVIVRDALKAIAERLK